MKIRTQPPTGWCLALIPIKSSRKVWKSAFDTEIGQVQAFFMNTGEKQFPFTLDSVKTKLLLLIVAALAVGELMRPDLIARADLAARTILQDGKTRVTLTNPFLELTFEPARGGRCVEFRFLDHQEQVIGTDAVSGMFLDHWAKYPWPSALLWLPYEHKIVGDGQNRAGIQLWVTVPAKGGGKGDPSPKSSAENPTSPELIGLVIRKTIWLNANDDVIEVEQEIQNPTAESRSVGLYLQHHCAMGGSHYYDNWYLPSGQGVVVNVQPEAEGGKTIGPDWVLDPTAGWIAVRDRQTDRGMLFVFDYNYVQRIYTSGATAEWFMESVPVSSGKSFAFQYLIKPVAGFRDFVYGSRRLVADIRPDEIAGKIQVTHDIAATSRPLVGVKLAVTVVGWKSKQVIAEEAFTIERLGFDKVTQKFNFDPVALSDGVVIKAVAQADGREERYEYYYAGDTAERESRYNFFATKGGALAGSKGDAYFVKPPRKVKKFDKPDFAALKPRAKDRFQCLVAFGLYTHILNLDDALAGWKSRNGSGPEFTWANCPPNGVETFPGSYDEIFSYHTIVLSDVNYRALGDIAFEMLCDYVEQGGALLVIGGPYALGNGEFEGSRFLDVLPARLSGPVDLKWAGKGQSWELKPSQASSPLLAGVSFDPKPRVFWQHAVTPKPDADVVLEAGGRPSLVLGRYGQGKVALLTLSPTGLGAEGETAWWEWNHWSRLVKNIFSWLDE